MAFSERTLQAQEEREQRVRNDILCHAVRVLSRIPNSVVQENQHFVLW